MSRFDEGWLKELALHILVLSLFIGIAIYTINYKVSKVALKEEYNVVDLVSETDEMTVLEEYSPYLLISFGWVIIFALIRHSNLSVKRKRE